VFGKTRLVPIGRFTRIHACNDRQNEPQHNLETGRFPEV
jgi:hypothetical protein